MESGEPKAKKSRINGTSTTECVENGVSESPPKKPILNAEGKIVYSKFDFAVPHESRIAAKGKRKKKDKKKLRNEFKGKDYTRLLDKAEKRKERIESLEAKGEKEKAERMKKSIAWDSAMQRAEGVKVKDNPELLKKAAKRKEKIKERSKKKWAQRENTVIQQKEKKQKKRQDNIQKRKHDKIKKKIERSNKRRNK